MLDLNTLYPGLLEVLPQALHRVLSAEPLELGETSENLLIKLRTAGIGALLVEYDVDKYYHMLMRSALTKIYQLEKMPDDPKVRPRFSRVSRMGPFFDALAADRFDLAERIVQLSPDKWLDRFEYEDDYCYAAFLHGLVVNRPDAEQQAILSRFAEVLDGEDSPRLDICTALLNESEDDFDQAFDDLLILRADEIVTQEQSLARNEIEFATGRYVFIEGLALLRLAARCDIQVEDEYEYCPEEARSAMMAPFPDDGYPA